MNGARVAAGAVVVIALMLTAVAAQRPDLSGNWALDWQASGLKGPDTRDTGLVLKQSADELTADPNHGPGAVMTFNLDGTPSTNKLPLGVVTSVAKWEGDKLLITSTVSVTGEKPEIITETYALEGEKLVSVGTLKGTTMRRVYTRAVGQPGQSAQKPSPTPVDPRERWNNEYASGIPSLRNAAPSEFLAGVIKGRKPGTALDLGIGQGRNAIFLASSGWEVTGIDISDVAVAQARKNAEQQGVKITTEVADLDAYDFGENRWDLVTSFYMHSWHMNSKTDVPARILRSLKPGGVLVMEAFKRPPNSNGFVVAELATQFRNFRIIRNEEAVLQADWGPEGPTPLVRFVAGKPQK